MYTGVVVPSDISSPCHASPQFCSHNECHSTVFRSRIASLHITSFTHTECSLNHQYLLCHQFQAQWMSTGLPVSVVSPVSCTLNVHWITSLCCLTGLNTLNVHWITSLLLRLTSLRHNECSQNHQFHAQCIPTVMVLLSEAPVTMSQSPWLPFMYAVNVPWCSVAIRDHQSVTAQSQFHAQRCPLNGAARLDHQSTTTSHLQCFTHTHTHTKCTMRNAVAIQGHQSWPRLVNSPFLYTMKGDITHRRPLPSHTNSPSWWFTHACSKPLAQSSETTGAITICLPNIPVLCTANSLLMPSLLVRSRPTHPPWSAKDAVHSPASVRTTPASQSGPTLSLLLNVTVQAPPPPKVSPRMPCTPLRVCAPSSGFPIRANTIIHIKCNCAGSSQTNSHTPHGQPTDNMHCPTACTPPPATHPGQHHHQHHAQQQSSWTTSRHSGQLQRRWQVFSSKRCIEQTMVTLPQL